MFVPLENLAAQRLGNLYAIRVTSAHVVEVFWQAHKLCASACANLDELFVFLIIFVHVKACRQLDHPNECLVVVSRAIEELVVECEPVVHFFNIIRTDH